MALGENQIKSIAQLVAITRHDCKKICDNMDGPWNTFNFVVQNSSNWASETEIGEQTIRELDALNGKMFNLTNNINKLCDKLDTFIDRQREINRGGG